MSQREAMAAEDLERRLEMAHRAGMITGATDVAQQWLRSVQRMQDTGEIQRATERLRQLGADSGALAAEMMAERARLTREAQCVDAAQLGRWS